MECVETFFAPRVEGPRLTTVQEYENTLLLHLLTAEVVGALQMTSQPLSSIFLCSPLPSGTCQTPGLSIPFLDVVLPLPFLSGLKALTN